MNDDVTTLRTLLPAYAGHDDAIARRLSDQQVRAWLGESLVDLQDRIPLAGLQDRFDKLLFRCEFGDQHVIRAIEHDNFAEPAAAAAVEKHDAALVSAAARTKTVDAGGLEGLIGELERAFEERAAGVAALLKG